MLKIIIATVLLILVFGDIFVSSKDYFGHHKNLKLMRLTVVTSGLLMIFWIVYNITVRTGVLPIALIFSYAFTTFVRFGSYKNQVSKESENLVGVIIIAEVEDEDAKKDYFLE